MTTTQPEEKLTDKSDDGKQEEDEMKDSNTMSTQEKLFYFARRGNVERLKEAARSVDVNAIDTIGHKSNPYISKNTALHYAVESGSLECVQVLFHLEANIEATNKLQCTPLHIAASLGYTDIVKFLIEQKANIETKNAIGNTPLHCAVYAGHTETVEYILSQLDEPRDALLEPNGIGMGAAKYTAHEDMKALLRPYFPKRKKNNDMDDEPQVEAQEQPPQYTNNDVQEEANDAEM